MDENEFNNKLRELINEIAALPKDKQEQLKPLVEETKKRHEDIKEDISKISRSLADLRICLKYLLFDLEATKRERDKMKAKLDKQQPRDDDPNKIEGEM
jgi:chromosome segregation ATPase